MTTFAIIAIAWGVLSILAAAIVMWRIHTTTEEERIANAGGDVHGNHAGDNGGGVDRGPVGA